MTFIQLPQRRIIPPAGPLTAKIAIIGEAGGAYENSQLKPFVGPAGGVLEQCLHAAGIIRSEVYLDNVVPWQPPKNDILPYYNGAKGTFTPAGVECVNALRERLAKVEANVIVACGATAFSALAGVKGIMKYRGYVFESTGLEEPRKVIPMIHPAAALRGMYIYRHLIAADLKKAKQQSLTREIQRPQRQLIYEYANVGEALEWLAYFEKQPIVAYDIEVVNYELACIDFCSDPSISCSIPVADRWSELDELQIWRGIQCVVGNPESIKVDQNGFFDRHFSLTRCGFVVRGPAHDTMIAHSIMFPELLKGLAFLGSIYCGAQEYWKDKVKFENIKDES